LINIKDPNSEESEPPKQFSFDTVYDWNASQRDLHDQTAQPLVQSAMQGYNVTFIAYGETGAGKTHTIQGNLAEKELDGIIPRAMKEVFKIIQNTTNKQYLVYCSFISIYDEVINDLLSSSSSPSLLLREGIKLGVFVKGVTWSQVKNSEEMFKLYLKGLSSQSILTSHMSRSRSRLASVFNIRLESFELNTEGKTDICVKNLLFIDLAGSERKRKTAGQGDHLRETTKISLSLSPLANVLSSLTNGKSKHIPYRDSKITRILQA